MSSTARLEMRMPREAKRVIERAAAALDQSVTAFALSALVERAEAVVAEQQRRELSEKDVRAFLRILDDERPNARLAKAMAHARAAEQRR